MVAAMKRWGIEDDDKVLFILSDPQENIILSLRNIERVKLMSASHLNIFDLLHADRLVITAAAMEKVQEVYGD
jgi:large subunit ribosomal protein L4